MNLSLLRSFVITLSFPLVRNKKLISLKYKLFTLISLEKKKKKKKNLNFLYYHSLRASTAGASNVKYLAFDTPNTKKSLTSGILNAKIFGMDEQCNLKF